MSAYRGLTLYPAIDLLGGRCVRLRQGDYAQVRVFDEDPLAVAARWQAAGAAWLHLVDLDGARTGQPAHLHVVRAVTQATGLPVQFGGGLRTLDAVAEAFAAGAARILLGTAAVRDPELLAACLTRWGERISVSVDARGDQVAVAGWLEVATEPATDFARRMADAGVRTLIVTDIERDGTLAGSNGGRLTALRALLPEVTLIAAGGVSSLDDIRLLARARLDGAVLGRALYEGTLDLAEALRVAREERPAEASAAASQEETPC